MKSSSQSILYSNNKLLPGFLVGASKVSPELYTTTDK